MRVDGEQNTDDGCRHSATTRAPLGQAKFRLHSRHRSIGGGRLEQLIKPNIAAGQLELVGEPADQVSFGRDVVEQRPAKLKEKCEISSELESVETGELSDMNQTVHSIRTLSIQISRATSQSDISQVVGAMEPMEQRSALAASRSQPGQQASVGLISSSSSKLGKLLGKKAGRMKETFLQNLGKAEKTNDELFEVYEKTFYKQQAQAMKLQKEFKAYINSLASTHEASKSLANCIQQSTGDYQSARHDLVCENLSHLEHLQDDLMDKLRSQVLVSMNEYLSQFSDLRNKIAKRHRKLIDFDSSRRVYESMLAMINKKRLQHLQPDANIRATSASNQQQQSRSTFRHNFFRANSCGQLGSNADPIQSATNQLVDEARLLKLREQYNYCKIMYETINGELYEELPTVYEKKMKHLLMTLQNFFTIETQYHSNAGKLFATAGDVIDELPMSIIGDNRNRNQRAAKPADSDDYNKAAASGSSGMGSSRGESSLESSSSPDSNPSDSETETRQKGHHHEATGEKSEVEDEEDEEEEDEEEVDESDDSSADDADNDDVTQHAGTAPTTHVTSGLLDAHQPDQQVKPQPIGTSAESLAFKSEVSIDLAAAARPVRLVKKEAESEVKGSGKEVSHLSSGSGDGVAGLPIDSELSNCAVAMLEPSSTDCKHPIAKLNAIVTDPEAFLADCAQVCPSHLYKVKTNYKYLAEDVDELCFEADEVIQVVEFDKTQEPEEGWLMGVREVNGQRGLFPANFTRPF